MFTFCCLAHELWVKFIKALVQPFNETDAYKLGIIDDETIHKNFMGYKLFCIAQKKK